MTTVLAQQETTTTTTSDGPGFLQNSWLDDYEFHFGEWIKQIVDWTDQNLGWLLDAFIWPFEFLFNLLMSPDETATSIMSLPWYWVGIIFFIIGSITRNTRVGIMVGSLVVACGLLGPDYWSETTKTFGLVFVSVFLCAIIGIPLGVLCGRVDAVWNAVRPVLDAMQVIHAFVYMLPFIFFWGPGEASATMATLVFALPPLVRLTNLGVRQVPSDVVEASRAFGASEMRVLTDVQLPLARPAILTGLNQTLLMAIGMLGIAAIMGAGGLGKLLLQAIASNNIPQATSAGLAYFFVAIVADRISQRESSDGLGLFGRIQEAWTYRADPEGLLAAQAARLENADSDVVTQAEAIVDDAASVIESEAPVNSVERLGLLIGFGGLAVAAVSAFLTWSNDSGLASAWGRAADVDVLPNGDPGLLGRSFSGIEASGGTLFAVFVLGLSVLGLFCAARPLLSFPGAEGIATQSRRLQGALITFIVAIGVAAWLANIFNGDMSAWLDGAGYNRIATAILLVAAIAGGEWIGRYLMGRTGLFIGAFAVAIVLWIVLGADRLSAIGVLAFAMVALALVVEAFVLGMPRLGADGMLILALGALGSAVGYFMLNEAPLVTAYSHGIGVYVALIGTAAAVVGGLMAVFAAPYTSRIPLKLDIKWSLIGGAAIALIAMFASLIAPWQSDARLDSLLSQEEIDAETARLTAEAGDDVNKQIAAAQEITNFINAAQSDPVQVNGIESGGPLIGWPTLAFSGAAVAMTVLAAGALGGDESRRWRFGTLVTGLGLAAMIIPAAWIFSFTRSAEPRAITGNGAFFTMVLAFIFIAIGRGVINDFRRRKIYSDMASAQSVVDVTDDPAMAGSAGA